MHAAQIRSLLFVPASAPDKVTKALASSADLVCLDLEDAVAGDDKASAREAALDVLATSGSRDRLCIRINPLDSLQGLEDAAALIRATNRPAFLMLPKVQSARDTELLAQAFGTGTPPGFIALLETPLGIEAAFAIAGTASVSALLFGSFDYAAQTGCAQEWSDLLMARSRLVAAAASAGKVALDSPFKTLDGQSGAADEARRARSLGFSGKAAIHPKFLAEINAAFTPTEAELAEARALLAAFDAAGGAVGGLGGTLVEAPVVRRMHALLARAARAPQG